MKTLTINSKIFGLIAIPLVFFGGILFSCVRNTKEPIKPSNIKKERYTTKCIDLPDLFKVCYPSQWEIDENSMESTQVDFAVMEPERDNNKISFRKNFHVSITPIVNDSLIIIAEAYYQNQVEFYGETFSFEYLGNGTLKGKSTFEAVWMDYKAKNEDLDLYCISCFVKNSESLITINFYSDFSEKDLLFDLSSTVIKDSFLR